MKYIIATFFLFFFSLSFAQIGFVKLNLGFGLPTFTSQVETFYSTRTDNLNAKVKQEAFSLGEGNYFGASISYLFSENFGFEMGFRYHIGRKQYFNQELLNMSVISNLERSVYGNRILLQPSFVIAIDKSKFMPYLKLGPSIGFINQRFHDKLTILDNETEQTWKYSGPTSLGFHSGIGLNYFAFPKIGFFLEINMLAMNYKPTSCDMEIGFLNGLRNDEGLNYFEKHIVFVEWNEDEFNQPQQSPDQPVYMNRPVFSYHSIEFSTGLLFKL